MDKQQYAEKVAIKTGLRKSRKLKTTEKQMRYTLCKKSTKPTLQKIADSRRFCILKSVIAGAVAGGLCLLLFSAFMLATNIPPKVINVMLAVFLCVTGGTSGYYVGKKRRSDATAPLISALILGGLLAVARAINGSFLSLNTLLQVAIIFAGAIIAGAIGAKTKNKEFLK